MNVKSIRNLTLNRIEEKYSSTIDRIEARITEAANNGQFGITCKDFSSHHELVSIGRYFITKGFITSWDSLEKRLTIRWDEENKL